MKFFKLILATMILTISANASDTYFFYVETPEIADSYFNIFNGIAKIFGSEDYLGLLRLVFLFGGFFVFISGVLQSWGQDAKGAISGYFKYLIGGVALLSIIFSKTATIVVKSETLPTYCSPGSSTTAGFTVDNIPEVLAYAFAFTNRFGREMTRIAEIAYTTPNADGSKSIVDSGGYIGALKQSLRLLSVDINKVSLADRNASRSPYDLGLMTRTILSQCILIPFSAKGTDGLAEITKLKSSKNMFNYLNDLYTSNPSIGGIKARSFQAQMGGETWLCGDLWDYIKPYYDQFKTDVVCSDQIGAGAVSIITGAANPPRSTFQDTAIQAGLVGELASVSNQLGIGVSGVSYASGKTRAEFVQSNMANGAYMAEMLPYLQMTIRAILYAFLPFVFVIVILPGGLKVITQYLQTLIWVELWSPTAAILNMFITQQAEYKISNEYSQNGVTVTNAIDMLSTGSTIAGVAGYLYMSVPALTWLIMKGSAYMLAGIGGAVAAGMSKNIQTDTINKDISDVKKAKEMSYQTGEEISVAESQHFEAIRNGKVAGATLGFEKNVGLNNVADAEVFKKSKDVSSFMQLRNMTGMTASSLGAADAMVSSYKKGAEVEAVNNTATSSLDDNQLNARGKAAQEQDQRSKEGEINAKAKNQYSKDDHYRDQLTKLAEVFKNSERVKADIALHKALGINLSPEQSVNRWAQSIAAKSVLDHAKNEQYTQKITGGANVVNENGTYPADNGKLGLRAIMEANTDYFNKNVDMGTVSRLKKEGITYSDIANKNVTNTMQQIGMAKGLRDAVNTVYENAGLPKDANMTANQKLAAVLATKGELSYVDKKGHKHTVSVDNRTGKIAYDNVQTGVDMSELGALQYTTGDLNEGQIAGYMIAGVAIGAFNKTFTTLKNGKEAFGPTIAKARQMNKTRKLNKEVSQTINNSADNYDPRPGAFFKTQTPQNTENISPTDFLIMNALK